jgi:hypothetical protein
MFSRLSAKGLRASALPTLVAGLIACVFALSAAAAAHASNAALAPARVMTRMIRSTVGGNAGQVKQLVVLVDRRPRWSTRRLRRALRHGVRAPRLRAGDHVVEVAAYLRDGTVHKLSRRIIVRRAGAHWQWAYPTSSPASSASSHPRTPVVTLPPTTPTAGPAVAVFNRETYAYSSALSLTEEAKRYQVMVLQATDGNLVSALHAANPNLKVLVYQHPWRSRPSDTEGLTVCSIYQDDLAQHPGWFLRDASGKPIPAKGYSDWLMDPGNAAYQQACIAHSIAIAKASGFDGVYLDEINASPQWDVTAGTQIPAYPTLTSWQNAMSSLLDNAVAQFHAHGLLAYANLGGTVTAPGTWQRWSGVLDGSEEEGWAGGSAGLSASPWSWASQLANVAWSEAHGKYTLIHDYYDSATPNIFGLASMLLVANGHTSFSTSNGDYTSTENWFPVYSLAQSLGAPTGAYTKLPNGVYERQFANGIVLVNPTSSSVPSFSLGGTYSGSGLTNVSTVSMGPSSGLILQSSRP